MYGDMPREVCLSSKSRRSDIFREPLATSHRVQKVKALVFPIALEVREEKLDMGGFPCYILDLTPFFPPIVHVFMIQNHQPHSQCLWLPKGDLSLVTWLAFGQGTEVHRTPDPNSMTWVTQNSSDRSDRPQTGGKRQDPARMLDTGLKLPTSAPSYRVLVIGF